MQWNVGHHPCQISTRQQAATLRWALFLKEKMGRDFWPFPGFPNPAHMFLAVKVPGGPHGCVSRTRKEETVSREERRLLGDVYMCTRTRRAPDWPWEPLMVNRPHFLSVSLSNLLNLNFYACNIGIPENERSTKYSALLDTPKMADTVCRWLKRNKWERELELIDNLPIHMPRAKPSAWDGSWTAEH